MTAPVLNFFAQAQSAEEIHRQMMKDAIENPPPGMTAEVVFGDIVYTPIKESENGKVS